MRRVGLLIALVAGVLTLWQLAVHLLDDPNEFVRIVKEDEQLDAGMSRRFEPRFTYGECQFSVRPADGGCAVWHWVTDGGAAQLTVDATSCAERFEVCARPFQCPCPFSADQVDRVAPSEKTWFDRVWQSLTKSNRAAE